MTQTCILLWIIKEKIKKMIKNHDKKDVIQISKG